jgi:hypothetical protein
MSTQLKWEGHDVVITCRLSPKRLWLMSETTVVVDGDPAEQQLLLQVQGRSNKHVSARWSTVHNGDPAGRRNQHHLHCIT